MRIGLCRCARCKQLAKLLHDFHRMIPQVLNILLLVQSQYHAAPSPDRFHLM
jgi:hypothetical protein